MEYPAWYSGSRGIYVVRHVGAGIMEPVARESKTRRFHNAFHLPGPGVCMGAFICDRCGKCCVSLGQHITIERQLNERDYYCRSKIDNALFLAHVDPAFREEVAPDGAADDASSACREPKPCRFLRKDPSGEGSSCAIYASRPKVCRDFRCYRMIIKDQNGTVCGKVKGKHSLVTDDPDLARVWAATVAAIPYSDSAGWIRQVAGILSGHGYSAEAVE